MPTLLAFDRAWSWAMVAAGLCVVGLFLWNAAHNVFLSDDAFISFRYSAHLVESWGLVWNEGERVEGYTNFLWVLLMAGGMLLGLEPMSFAAALGTASGIAILLLLAQLSARTLGWGTLLVWLAPALLALNRSFAAWSTSGLETQLFSLLVLLGNLNFLRERVTPGSLPLASALSFALAALTRPEGILFAGIAGAFFLWDVTLRRRLLRHLVVWSACLGALVGGHFVWRKLYYGFWLPNTFYTKVSGLWIDHGAGYMKLFADEYLILWLAVLVLAHLAFSRSFTDWYLLAATGIYSAYVIAIGGDRFEFRFMVPVLPYLYVLFARAVAAVPEHLARLQPPRGIPKPIGVALTAALATASLLATHQASLDSALQAVARRGTLELVDDIHEFTSWNIARGQALRHLVEEGYLPPDTRISVGGAGATPYYSRLYTLDRYGLNNVEIAHQPITKRTRIAHEKEATPEQLTRDQIDLLEPNLERIPPDPHTPPETCTEREHCIKGGGYYIGFTSHTTQQAMHKRLSRFEFIKTKR